MILLCAYSAATCSACQLSLCQIRVLIQVASKACRLCFCALYTLGRSHRRQPLPACAGRHPSPFRSLSFPVVVAAPRSCEKAPFSPCAHWRSDRSTPPCGSCPFFGEFPSELFCRFVAVPPWCCALAERSVHATLAALAYDVGHFRAEPLGLCAYHIFLSPIQMRLLEVTG